MNDLNTTFDVATSIEEAAIQQALKITVNQGKYNAAQTATAQSLYDSIVTKQIAASSTAVLQRMMVDIYNSYNLSTAAGKAAKNSALTFFRARVGTALKKGETGLKLVTALPTKAEPDRFICEFEEVEEASDDQKALECLLRAMRLVGKDTALEMLEAIPVAG